MNNPFFVLTSDDNEIIGVIRNPKWIHALGGIDLHDSIYNALNEHYDAPIFDIKIHDRWFDIIGPITIAANISEENEDPSEFRLIKAWQY